MGLGFHHSKLPAKGPFTWFCAVFLDIYEIPFPGIVLSSSPWIGGYTASPILYLLFAYGPLSMPSAWKAFFQPLGPFELVTANDSASDWLSQVRLGLACMYVFHFARRLLESIFLNKYTGKTRRLSDVELSYYVMWGCICGFSGSATMVSTFGVVTPPVYAAGVAIWAFGQAANCYCHYLLQMIKSQSDGGEHVIPYVYPFNKWLMPHYTAEMIGWGGFAICSGINTASITIWTLSLCVLQIWTHSRRVQYLKMHKDGHLPQGQSPAVDAPSMRWGVLPGLERM